MPYHLLLVDDDPYFRSEFKEFMEDFNVIEAASGQEAVRILRKPHQIDTIVIDEHLPDTKGTELLEQIHVIAPTTPTIVLTGYSSKEVAIDAVKAHASDYVEKPLTPDKIEMIRNAVLCAPRGELNKPASGIRGKIEQAKYFAQRNYDKKLTLKDVANELCLSPKYLSRIFIQQTGQTFVDYKLGLRMNKAKQLLKDSGDTIDAISVKLGYQNTESFGRIFKQHAECSPRAYREQDRRKLIKALNRPENTRLRHSATHAKKVILSSPTDAIIEHDLAGNIIFWSQGAERMYGYKEHEITRRKIFDTFPLAKRKRYKDVIQMLIKTKSVDSFKTQRNNKNGKPVDIWMTIIPEAGAPARIITIEREFSRLQQTTDKIIREKNVELSKAQEQLQQTQHLAGLGRFSSIIAHEIRRPINSIQLAAWNIRQKIDDPSISGNLQCIEEMVDESDQIINNLLNYAHIKKPSYKSVVIRALLEQCIESAEFRFAAKKINVRRNLRSLNNIKIVTDPVQFKQVISNILMNAYDALTGRTQPVLTVDARAGRQNLVIRIADNGKGIAAEDLAKIYEPFFSKKQKGTGLGLSVCKEIVALHHGQLKINSKFNKGTSVTIELPLKKNV